MTITSAGNLDREHYVWGRMTARQFRAAVPFGVFTLASLIAGGLMEVRTPGDGTIGFVAAVLGGIVTFTIAYVPSPKGRLMAYRRKRGPQTFVNGPVDALPRELRYPGWRKDRKRVAALSAPFEGFDEKGRYAIAGGFTRVMSVSPVDDELLSEKERNSLSLRFRNLLHSLAGHASATITGEPFGLEAEAQRIRHRHQRTGGLRDYAEDHAAYLAAKTGERRQIFLAIHGPDAQTTDQRGMDATDQMKRMGRHVHWLSPSETAQLTARMSGGTVPHRAYPADPTVKDAS